MADPIVAVVIPTVNRPQCAVRAVRSVYAGDAVPDRCIVIDQSRDGRTADVLAALGAYPGLRHVPSRGRGIAAALNEGIRQADADIVAITGDDCTVAGGWLQALVRCLVDDADTGVVFGAIAAASHDERAGFVPSYDPPGFVIARRSAEKDRISGTSACMALRTDAWRSVSGFDESFGVGAHLRSGEDADLTLRVLAKGSAVREIPTAVVTHHGFFSWDQRPDLLERNWYGTGAAFAKAVRVDRIEALRHMARMGMRWARGGSRVAAGLGTGPHRLRTLRAFANGFRVGLVTPLDPRTGHFAGAPPGLPDLEHVAGGTRG